MLVELSVMEQRYQAVLAVVRDGWTVTDVAEKWGVSRQSVHAWLARYRDGGLEALADRSHRPKRCPHQVALGVEARICEMRGRHPGWGPRRLAYELAQAGVEVVPSRSGIYRCLVRNGLIEPKARQRRRRDYKRWERARPMELWQIDVVGGVEINDAAEHKVVTGVDDHSRFCVMAGIVERATARAVCGVFADALQRWGVPDEVLTDNGKVFTNRLGPKPTEVLFDRICRDNAITHRLTAVRSPTTTGKIERFHRTLRVEFLTGRTFPTMVDAQAQLDGWVHEYNIVRPHQALNMATPHDRFTVGTATAPQLPPTTEAVPAPPMPVVDGQWIQRLVAGTGVIGIESRAVAIGRKHAHAIVDCCVTDTLIHIWDAGEHVHTVPRTTTGPIRNPAIQRRGRVKQQPKSKRQASTGT
ncbi:MAG: hypothetical protein QOI08_2306 [Actinomycetota bacterium]|jgi:transposase InsO family protein|nr:hypothetical protein [Actinomycetota bacterium]